MRLTDYLREQCVSFQTILHAPAFSPMQRARILRIEPSHVAHAVLLDGPQGLFVHVLPATHQTDLDALARVWGAPVRIVRKDEAATVFRDCSWGVVSPFGNLYGLWTLIDRSIDPNGWLILEADTPVDSILLDALVYERLSGAFGVSCATPLGNSSPIVCNRRDES